MRHRHTSCLEPCLLRHRPALLLSESSSFMHSDLPGWDALPISAPSALVAPIEERFRILVESVQDYAIFMLDPEGRIVSWNTGAQKINGYTADEVVGLHFSA